MDFLQVLCTFKSYTGTGIIFFFYKFSYFHHLLNKFIKKSKYENEYVSFNLMLAISSEIKRKIWTEVAVIHSEREMAAENGFELARVGGEGEEQEEAEQVKGCLSKFIDDGSVESHRYYLSRRTTLEMLRDRGYSIPSSEIDLSLSQFRHMHGHSPDPDRLRLSLNHATNPSKRVSFSSSLLRPTQPLLSFSLNFNVFPWNLRKNSIFIYWQCVFYYFTGVKNLLMFTEWSYFLGFFVFDHFFFFFHLHDTFDLPCLTGLLRLWSKIYFGWNSFC